jgi:putative transferase (TIGR04331 family)
VVHNYLGTSWLETLVMNIPTVCFYDPDTYAFRDAAQPFIERLEAVGILHRSGVAAARHVVHVRSDPQGWWRRPDIQEAREAFVDRYANFSRDWAVRWEAEFRTWIE